MSEKKRCYKYCIVPKCKSTTLRTPNKIFFAVPKNEKMRKKWCRIIKRINPVPLSCQTSVYCCEDHFNVEEDMENYVKYKLVGGIVKLKEGVVPHKFDWQEKKEVVPRSAFAKRRTIEFYEKLLSKEIPVSVCTQEAEFADCGRIEVKLEEKPINPIALPLDTNLKERKKTKCNKSTQVNIKKKTKDISTNTPRRRTVKHEASEKSHDYERKFDPKSFEDPQVCSSLSYNNLMKEAILVSISREPKLLVGLPRQCYFCIKLLTETIKTTDLNVMITFKKIRLNQSYSLLALDFGLSQRYVTKIVRKTLPYIAGCMKDLIIFPSEEQIQSNIPRPYGSRYDNMHSIIDCFEVQIEKPSNALQQALTWSNYKNCNTIKFMISITPDGFINYVSDGYGGRYTDTCIFEDCDYLSKLPPEAVVIADRGFKNIAHFLEQRNCTLLQSSSVQSDVIPTKKEIKKTKRKAALRVHVERTIGRLQEFGFLLPHACVDSEQIDMLDYIVVTACGIVNLQSILYYYST